MKKIIVIPLLLLLASCQLMKTPSKMGLENSDIKFDRDSIRGIDLSNAGADVLLYSSITVNMPITNTLTVEAINIMNEPKYPENSRVSIIKETITPEKTVRETKIIVPQQKKPENNTWVLITGGLMLILIIISAFIYVKLNKITVKGAHNTKNTDISHT